MTASTGILLHVTRARDRLLRASGPALSVVLSLLVAAQSLRLWEWRPGTPLSLTGDAPPVLVQVDAILRGNWYGLNHGLGAPFGLNQGRFTTVDLLNFATVRAIGVFSADPATVATVFFVLGYPAAALAAYWLARQLRCARPAAVVVGVLFSALPGHQEWFGHLWLAAYWMVPLGLWLVLGVAGEGVLRPRWLVVVAVVVVGLADVYYVAFTLLLLAGALAYRWFGGTSLLRLVPRLALTVAVALVCGLSFAVALHGRAEDVVTGALPASRTIGESEVYAGRLVDLFLPWHEHRWEPLSFLTRAYGIAAGPSIEHPALGVVALAGLVVLLWRAIASLARHRALPRPWGMVAAVTLVSLLFYVRGGLGSLVALFVTPQIRTWSRFVVVIALLALVAVGLLLTRLQRRWGRAAGWSVAMLLLVVGVADQTNPAVAPDYRGIRAEQSQLAAYTLATATATGGDCPVFQLPVVAYPEEAPPGKAGDYDGLLLPLASPPGTSWSYGAIRGTARADWQLALPLGDPAGLARGLKAAGFCAVSVDHDGYAGASDPTSALSEVAGAPVAQGWSGRLTAFSLREVPMGPIRRDDVLRPVVASLDGSLVDVEGSEPFQRTGPDADLRVANMGAEPRRVTLQLTVTGVGDDTRTVTVRSGRQSLAQVVVASDRQESVSLQLTVPPGTTRLALESSGDPVPVPGTEGRETASLTVSAMTLTADGSTTNAASAQQFAAASPRSLR